MKLIGEYTSAGAVLSARVLTGQFALKISRAAAGSGSTDVFAIALENEKQQLAVYPCIVTGSTLTVPVRLTSLEAAAPYTMTEVGLYALDAEGAEVLYKVYRISQPVSVSPDCSLVANLYLSDTVLPGSAVDASIDPSGMLTREDADAIRAEIAALPTTDEVQGMIDTLTVYTPPVQTLSCAASALQSTIDALPKALDREVKITVASGTFSGSLKIDGFLGRGGLTIIGTNAPTITGAVEIINCDLPVLRFENFKVSATQLKAMDSAALAGLGYNTSPFHVRDCRGEIHLKKVTITEPETMQGCGFYVRNASCALDDCFALKRYAYVAGNWYARVRMAFQNGSAPSNTCTHVCYMENCSILYRQNTAAGATSYFYKGCSFFLSNTDTSGALTEGSYYADTRL